MTGPDDRFAPLGTGSGTAAPAATLPEPEFEPVLPAPEEPPLVPPGRGHPAGCWVYRDAEGRPLFAVYRYDRPEGGKDIRPLVWARGAATGKDGWRWGAAPVPRPLYGLDRLAARPDAPVLLVEGEKTADAAAARFPDLVAVTWPGGAHAVRKVDWSPLSGRTVTIWPDHDEPGRGAADKLERVLAGCGAGPVRRVRVPEDWPEGWDLADPLPDATDPAMPGLLLEQAEPADRPQGGDAPPLAVIEGGKVVPLHAATANARSRAGTDPASGLPPDPRRRADLFISDADRPDVAEELALHLATLPHLFHRNGPVRLTDDPDSRPTLSPLCADGVIIEAHRTVRPWRRTPSGETRELTLPLGVARLYLARAAYPELRSLDGFAAAPLLNADGSVRAAAGYDPGHRIWCLGVPGLALPDRPSRAEAQDALGRLRRFLRTFPFRDSRRTLAADASEAAPVVDLDAPPGQDESAALAGLMTAVCRPSLHLAPALLVRAASLSGAGTGKGLLIRVLCAIANGRSPRATTAGTTREELDKRIAAAMAGADPVLFLDNVNNKSLSSDALASVITERPAQVRALGGSAMVLLNPAAFVAVSGNGVGLSEDLARRFLVVELDARTEHPEARQFPGDILRDAFDRRADLLADCLTIWRWGRQQEDRLPAGRPLGSFQQWGRWCRDPLLGLGCADPAARVAETKANDPERRQVAELFDLWWDAHGDQPVTASDLAVPVRAALDPPDGQNRQAVVRRLGELEGTRQGGRVLSRIRTAKWSPDRYVLTPTDEDREQRAPDPESHRGHRGHGAGAPPSAGESCYPGPGTDPDALPDDRGHGGPHRAGIGVDPAAEILASGPMNPMTPMPPATGARTFADDPAEGAA